MALTPLLAASPAMSAIRNNASRRSQSRSTHSPYARPQSKKSSWSISRFLNLLNPLRLGFSKDAGHEADAITSGDHAQNSTAAESLSKRGHQIARELRAAGSGNAISGPSNESSGSRWTERQRARTPMTNHDQDPSRAYPAFSVSASPARNLVTVKEFLTERAGKAISEVEVEGLVSLIDKSTPMEDPPFRFSSTTPSSPDRGCSPVEPSNMFSFTVPQAGGPAPRKILSRNPNGVYKWQGGGSAKAPRSRNRYSSPAFGPSRSAPDRLILKEAQPSEPTSDTKRRRIGDDFSTSYTTLSSPDSKTTNGSHSHRSSVAQTKPEEPLHFPVLGRPPSTPRANDLPGSRPDRPPAPPLLRVPQRPTAPSVPSPLRQAWTGSSPTQSDSGTSQQKQTKAANFMAELIKEVTPPKRPDLSNPYQTANPLGKVGAPAKPRVVRRTRATGRATPLDTKNEKAQGQDKAVAGNQAVVKGKGYSAQAIIEATVPKGSKRSRPPAYVEKSASPPSSEISLPSERLDASRDTVVQSIQPSPIVEEVEDVEERRTKKSKPFLTSRGFPSTAFGVTSSSDITIEEIDTEAPVGKPKLVIPPPSSVKSTDVGSASPPVPSNKSSFIGFKAVSVPKEPSKLRYSYQPEGNSTSSTSTSTPTSTDAPDSLALAPEAAVSVSKRTMGAKEVAFTMPMETLPTFMFTVSTNTPPPDLLRYSKIREDVQALPKSTLPSFDFTVQALKPGSVSNPFIAPAKEFDWSAAGLKPASRTSSEWVCSTCMLINLPTSTEKCGVCDAPRFSVASKAKVESPLAAPVKGFDWAAAGMKPAASNSSGQVWVCQTCMLNNPASAVDKCTVCDAPR